jgi:hypothetical protein
MGVPRKRGTRSRYVNKDGGLPVDMGKREILRRVKQDVLEAALDRLQQPVNQQAAMDPMNKLNELRALVRR